MAIMASEDKHGHMSDPEPATSPRPKPINKTSSILRSSFNASARFLSKIGSGGEGRGNGRGIIGSLLTAIGLSGKDEEQVSGVPLAPGTNSGRLAHCDSGHKAHPISLPPAGTLARLSSAIHLRNEPMHQSGTFHELRNDSFSMPQTTKLARRASQTNCDAPHSPTKGSSTGGALDRRSLQGHSMMRNRSISVPGSAPGSPTRVPGGHAHAERPPTDEKLPPLRKLSSVKDRPPTPHGPRTSATGDGAGGGLVKMLGSFRLPEVLGGKSPNAAATAAAAAAKAPFADPSARQRSSSHSSGTASILAGAPVTVVRPSAPSASAALAAPRAPSATASRSPAPPSGRGILANFQHSLEDDDGAALMAVEEEFDRRFGRIAGGAGGSPTSAGWVPEPTGRTGSMPAPTPRQRAGHADTRPAASELSTTGRSTSALDGALACERPRFRRASGVAVSGEGVQVLHSHNSSNKLRLASIRQSCQGGIVAPAAPGADASPAPRLSLPGIVHS